MAALTELQKTNYVLGTFMLVIALSAIAQIIYYLRSKQPKSKPMILLFIIVCSHAIVRAVYNFLPSIVYKNMMLSKQGMTKIMTLDLFPETIFLLMFWLLVCTWMETWIRVRTWKKEVKKVFWWVFPVGCAIIGISLIITIACSTRKSFTYIEIAKQEYNYIVTFIGVIMGSALIFGVLVYRVFREITIKPGESTHRKRQSFLKLVIIASLSLIVKAVYLGTMSLVIRDRRTKGEISNVQFAIIWFFYYAVTEMMPSIAVLSVFVDNQRRGKSLGSTSHTATGNENGPNSVPLSIKASSDDGTVLSSAKASTEDLDGITTGSNAEMTKEDEDELSASDSEDV